MSLEPDDTSQALSPSFDEDEDNNPFLRSHQGLDSYMANKEDGRNSKEQSSGINDDDSLLLYQSSSKVDAKARGDAYNAIQISYQSRVTKLLQAKSKLKIEIKEAGNSNEGMNNSSKKYVVYTIKLINQEDPSEEIQTRRRYSDFGSLREVLTKIFPLVIIPPIPPKNYFNFTMLNGLVNQPINGNAPPTGNGNSPIYSYINSNHLNKNKLIEHRKRLLSNFLNNCLAILQIRNLEFFAKFLDPNANWSDEISLITSQLPKSIYLSNPENGLKTDPIYNNLPIPVSNHTMSFIKGNGKKLSNKTNRLLSSSETASTANSSAEVGSKLDNSNVIITSNLDDLNKKLMNSFMGLSNDYNELGTVLNSFSLILSGSSKTSNIEHASDEDDIKLNIVFDKIGQIFDRSYITINSLIGDLETKFSEPLGEAVQYSAVLEFIIKFHERKIRQKKMLDNELKDKRKELEELLKAEEESSRIENALNNQAIAKNSKYNLTNANSKDQNNNSNSTSHPSGKYKLFPSMHSFKKITQYLSEIIDQNPDETRKQKIITLQAKITTLEKCQDISLQDINYITDELSKNFKVFHARQLKVIYEILLSYNGYLIEWAKKEIEIWDEIKEEIEKI